jgi:hypothetical protein
MRIPNFVARVTAYESTAEDATGRERSFHIPVKPLNNIARTGVAQKIDDNVRKGRTSCIASQSSPAIAFLTAGTMTVIADRL